jgi:hypothetical protein
MMRVLSVLFLFSVSSAVVSALKLFANRYIPTPSTSVRSKSLLLQAIPLELTGQLDSTKSWDVTFIFNGEEKVRMFV